MNRRMFFATTSCVVTTGTAVAQHAENDHEAPIRRLVQNYVDAREASDPKAIEALFTVDADQLVSDGTWRRGRDELVKGMLESVAEEPGQANHRY